MASIALCVICKNEISNLPRLLASVAGCFDEVHITDTGSTDGTLEYIKSIESSTTKLHHFEWVDDFAAARNYSFSHAKTDYIMWLDCDDVLVNKDAFIEWKDSLIGLSNYWFATYQYGYDHVNDKPTCTFMRERVIKNHIGLAWRYFVHEGIPPASHIEPIKIAYAPSWVVKHMRSVEDMKADKNRNLNIFKRHLKAGLDDRMKYYYGKELFEANQPMEAFIQLDDVIKTGTALEQHDKILAHQYACMAAMMCAQYQKGIDLAYEGLKLAPHRAEFYVIIGDCYLKLQKFDEALPSFAAAAHCTNQAPNEATFQNPIFTNAGAYTHYPRNQMGRIYFQRQQIDKAKKVLEESAALGPDIETGNLLAEIIKVDEQVKTFNTLKKDISDEYVITAPQNCPYQWDENVAKERGVGGSETAAIQMARWLHKLSGKKVRVFQNRQDNLEIDGVYYEGPEKMREYFSKNTPKAHIMWRHNMKFSDAPSYIWCHDLATPGMDVTANYEKIISLSEFHKGFLQHMYKIPVDKILVSRNGIDLGRFAGIDFSLKDSNKIVFSSSADRGLERAIKVVKAARKDGRDLKLHVFYGFANMEKMGLTQEVIKYRKLIEENPFVVYHGNVQQDELVNHLNDAKVWLYPTDFLETFCITALEMIACRVKPVVRSYGALPNTLKDLPCVLADFDCANDNQVEEWSKLLLLNIDYPQPAVDMASYSWESVAREWLTWLPQ